MRLQPTASLHCLKSDFFHGVAGEGEAGGEGGEGGGGEGEGGSGSGGLGGDESGSGIIDRGDDGC